MAVFSPENLFETLKNGPGARRYFVGYSGGADSTALLAALFQLRHQLPEIQAVHFNHGVMEQSASWQAHCERQCREWGFPIRAIELDLQAEGPSHFEEKAREKRYGKVREWLGEGDVYLTAHHRDDQAETLLLNLVRGAGLLGMAGIPRLRRLGAGWVMRPLLDVSREQLQSYLAENQLTYCRDPSNEDRAFDRNFLRHEIMPALDQRWPGVRGRLARAANHARNSSDLLAEWLETRSGVRLDDPVLLPRAALGDPAEPFAGLLLRHWLRKHETPGLPESRLEELMRQLSSAEHAEVRWSGWVIRAHREFLWLQSDQPRPTCPETSWSAGKVLDLGAQAGKLEWESAGNLPATLRVRARRPGDRIRPRPDAPSRSIKQLFQLSGTPPWLRDGVPVLCLGDEPVGLGDWIIDESLAQLPGAGSFRLAWHPADPGLAAARAIAHQTTVDRTNTVS